jgi:hypothetical protein
VGRSSLAEADLATRLGGGIIDAATVLLDQIVSEGSGLRSENFKFISETILATSRIGSPQAAALNARLGTVLFSAELRAVLLRNPRSVVMYAMPATFLLSRSARAAGVLALFQRMHEAGGTKALHNPTYRNVEMDFIAARISGEHFFHNPFVGVTTGLPWFDRDLVYGITHVHFYNSNFGARAIDYPAGALAVLEVLIAQAAQGGDVDVLLELLICYATVTGASDERLAFHDHLASEAIAALCLHDGSVPEGDLFRDRYHPLLVAAIYLAARAGAFAPAASVPVRQRHETLGALMGNVARCELIEFLSGYADHIRVHGPEEAIEPALELQMSLLAAGAHDRANGDAPLVQPLMAAGSAMRT